MAWPLADDNRPSPNGTLSIRGVAALREFV